MSALRILLALGLLAIAAWVVAWRRARPDLAPRWLAVKLTLLLGSIAGAAVGAVLGVPAVQTESLGIAAVVGLVVAARLWWRRPSLPSIPTAADFAAAIARAEAAERHAEEATARAEELAMRLALLEPEP